MSLSPLFTRMSVDRTKDLLRILLADDDEDDRMFFTDALKATEIPTDVVTVADGLELMSYLSTHEKQLPHVLFLDLNMPRKGGMECLREIRSESKFKEVAIAIYSTSGSESDIDTSFMLGANIYIKKPSDFTSLKKVIGEVVSINWQYHISQLNRENFLMVI